MDWRKEQRKQLKAAGLEDWEIELFQADQPDETSKAASRPEVREKSAGFFQPLRLEKSGGAWRALSLVRNAPSRLVSMLTK